MIYITGDIHGEIDIHKLANWRFPMQKTMTRDDFIIICGDFGLVWNGGKTDLYWQKWLENKPFTTLFVSGNHENFELLEQYPVAEWHGGKVQFIQPHVIHLMRGQVYDINGLKFFTMGGASSHDMWCRTAGISWWPQELPSADEYEEARKNLSAADWKVDVVLTHCGPNSVQDYVGCGGFETDKLTDFLEDISQRLTWKKWYMGHYHRDEAIGSYRLLYDDIVELVQRKDLDQNAYAEPEITTPICCDWCEDPIDPSLEDVIKLPGKNGIPLFMHDGCAVEYKETVKHR